MAKKYDLKVAAEAVMRCFHARTAAHVLHLKTGSYAEHAALQEFYEGVIDLADRLAEAVQGEYLEILPLSGVAGYQTPTSSLALVTGLTKWIESNREQICDSPQCQAIVDDILELCHGTAYKIKFLK
jgi:hypothetical protein